MTSWSKEEPDNLLRVLAGRTVTYKHSIRRLVRAVQLYLDSFDRQSPDWYTGLES